MPNQYVRSGYAGGREQVVQLRDDLGGIARHGSRVAASPRRSIGEDDGSAGTGGGDHRSGSVVDANPVGRGEPGQPRAAVSVRLQISPALPHPDCRTTVGLCVPVHSRCRVRRPTSTAAEAESDVVSGAEQAVAKSATTLGRAERGRQSPLDVFDPYGVLAEVLSVRFPPPGRRSPGWNDSFRSSRAGPPCASRRKTLAGSVGCIPE